MHEISWFTARIGKDVVRSYAGNDTVVTILKGEKADKYMHELQAEGFTFRDTAQTIAEAQYDFELPVVEAKKSGKIRIHVSDEGCPSCSA